MPPGSLSWGLLLCTGQVLSAPHVYKPEEYSSACLGVIGTSYYWDGSQCDGLRERNLTTCQCRLPQFLETVVSCVDQLIDAEEDEPSDNRRLQAYKSIVSQCEPQSIRESELSAFHTNSSSLEPYIGYEDVEEFGKCNASTAFRPTFWEASNAIQAYHMSLLTLSRSHRAGAGVLAYWGGVMLIRFILHWTFVLMPQSRRIANTAAGRALRRIVTVPATFTYKHSQAQLVTRHFPMNIPTREQTMIIIGFIAVHFGLTFGMLPVHQPSYLFEYNYRLAYSRELAFRTGKLVVFEAPLLMLFAGRNNVLQWFTGWSHDTYVVFHKWIARTVAATLLIHAGAHTAEKLSRGNYSFMWKLPYWNYGVAGGVFCGVLVFQAMYVFRRFSYEIFLVLHIILAVGFVVSGYYHLKLQEIELQYYYAMWAVWAFDRAMRMVRVLISSPLAKAELRLHEGNVVEYTIQYSNLWRPRPGDYVFVHIVHWTCFWQSHPFTVSRGVRPDEERTLKLFTRVKSGITKRMMKRALQNDCSFLTNVWIDGPYGPSYDVKGFEEALFLTGGIGITAPFSYIQGILEDPKSKTTRIRLYWAIGDDTPLNWFKHQIDYMKDSGKVEIFVFKGGSRRVDPRFEQDKNDGKDSQSKPVSAIEYGWPRQSLEDIDHKLIETKQLEDTFSILTEPLDTAAVVRRAIAAANGPLAILSCAPDTVNDSARATVASELSAAPHYVEYFEESFSW